MEDKSHIGMYNCFFCLEPIGVFVGRRLRKSLPQNVGVLNMEPCDECKQHMQAGVILISVKDSTTAEEMQGPIPTPYRTGGSCVITDDAIKIALDDVSAEWAIDHRFLFVSDDVWDKLGLPRGK